MKKSESLQNSNFVIRQDTLLKEAMSAITDNHRGTVIVVNDDFNLIGVLSDGDIRRGMLGGRSIMSPITSIINLNPVKISETVAEETKEKAKGIFSENAAINLIPVVDNDNKLIDIVVREVEK